MRPDAFSGGCLRAAVVSGAMTDIVKENYRKLAELLAGRENWHPEEAGEDGARGWCFGVEGAGRLTIVSEMDGFLMVVHDQERSVGPPAELDHSPD